MFNSSYCDAETFEAICVGNAYPRLCRAKQAVLAKNRGPVLASEIIFPAEICRADRDQFDSRQSKS